MLRPSSHPTAALWPAVLLWAAVPLTVLGLLAPLVLGAQQTDQLSWAVRGATSEYSRQSESRATELGKRVFSARVVGNARVADSLSAWSSVFSSQALNVNVGPVAALNELDSAAKQVQSSFGRGVLTTEALRIYAANPSLRSRGGRDVLPSALREASTSPIDSARRMYYLGYSGNAEGRPWRALTDFQGAAQVLSGEPSFKAEVAKLHANVELEMATSRLWKDGINDIQAAESLFTLAGASSDDQAIQTAVLVGKAHVASVRGNDAAAATLADEAWKRAATYGGSAMFSADPSTGATGALLPTTLAGALPILADYIDTSNPVGAYYLRKAHIILSYSENRRSTDAFFRVAKEALDLQTRNDSLPVAELMVLARRPKRGETVGYSIALEVWLRLPGRNSKPFRIPPVRMAEGSDEPVWGTYLDAFLCLGIPEYQVPREMSATCDNVRHRDDPRHDPSVRRQRGAEALERLSNLFIAGDVDSVLQTLPSNGQLQVTMQRDLALLPFPLLRLGNGKGEELGTRFAIRVALPRYSQGREVPSRGSLVIMSALDTIQFENTRDVFEPLDPQVRSLTRELADSLHAEVVAGDSVSKEAILSKLGWYDYIHITAHGGRTPMPGIPEPQGYLAIGKDSTSAFGDGLLARDIADGPVLRRGAIVTLAACESVLTPDPSHPELGVGEAFLSVGAQAVVGTLWQVRETVALTFYRYFYSAMHRGENVANAYFDAETRIRGDFPQGADWGAFLLMGAVQ